MKKNISIIVLLSFAHTYCQGQIVNNPTTDNKMIVVNTFSSIPKEIDGGGCSFYLSETDRKKEKYILVNDLAELAFMTINGKIEKFKLKSYKRNPEVYSYSNKDYQLIITIKKNKPVNHELINKEGVLEIKKGNDEIKINFIGDCGD